MPGFPILETERLSPTLTRLLIEAPLVARKRQAGHFGIVRATDTGERIPLTIVEGSPEAGTITLIVQAVGHTTRLICGLAPGQRLADVVGPLGNPTPVHLWGEVACVGGGVGTAEVYPIARALRAAGNTVHAIIGARTRDLLVLESEMAGCSDSLVVTTDLATPRGEGPAYSFPSPERLASCTEAELRGCKMGFRAPYLLATARSVAEGACRLEDLHGAPLQSARACLMDLPGVGRKIADCALLFAYGLQPAFPIDVWVLKALKQLYFPRRRVTLKRLHRFAGTHFGPNAGYALQYLFHYMRTRHNAETS